MTNTSTPNPPPTDYVCDRDGREIHVAYHGAFGETTGYGQAAMDYMLALHRAGVSLEIHPFTEDVELLDPEFRYDDLMPLVVASSNNAIGPYRKDPTHVIAHTVPAGIPGFLPATKQPYQRIGITTWETSHLPEEMMKSLDAHCDIIVVPSLFCREVMSSLDNWKKQEYRHKYRMVPHCFSPDDWPVSEEVRPADAPYRFYSILGWSERKNPVGLLKAYLSEFKKSDSVILRLKLSSFSADDVQSLICSTNIPIDELPALEIITDVLDHEDMVDFHNENDCFVTAARGEGWNLPAFEAAVLGNAVIAPSFGGHTEFMEKSSVSFSVGDHGICHPRLSTYGGTITPVFIPPQRGTTMVICGISIDAEVEVAPHGIRCDQSWFEPNLNSLKWQMRAVYEARQQKDHSCRQDFEDLYGYDRVSRRLIDILERTTR